MDNKNDKISIAISIKQVEKNVSKTYTDNEQTIETLNKITKITNRSFNDVLKSIVASFIDNGTIYDPSEKEYYSIKQIIEKYKE